MASGEADATWERRGAPGGRTNAPGAAPPATGPQSDLRLLEDAAHYATGGLAALSAAELALPTPCIGWDLGLLLPHLGASVAALHEGLRTGRIALTQPSPRLVPATAPTIPEPERDPIAALSAQIADLPARCRAAAEAGQLHAVQVADQPLAHPTLLRAGALELTVHGWDIRRARHGPGTPPPPAALATSLLRVVPELLPPAADRGTLFAAPVSVPSTADPGTRLLAHLGRDAS